MSEFNEEETGANGIEFGSNRDTIRLGDDVIVILGSKSSMLLDASEAMRNMLDETGGICKVVDTNPKVKTVEIAISEDTRMWVRASDIMRV